MLRVLVVDDSEGSAKTLGWAAEMFGYDVRIARDGPKAVEIARAYLPHIMLVDIGLPRMNGYEVCRSLKQYPEFQDTVFIAQTGWDQAEHRILSAEAGFQHHLIKPIDLIALKTIMSSIESSSFSAP
jgi:CheY-like chemotaxis protein